MEMNVRILPESNTSDRPCGDYVRVSTRRDPNDDTVTLATIERIVEKQRSAEAASPKVHVKTLVMSQPMSPDQAIGLATCYAERKNIQVVYTARADA
jgi:hypothetical protein